MLYMYELQVVYPKTDEQRLRLNEAVKNILLFKNLENVSTCIMENKSSSF